MKSSTKKFKFKVPNTYLLLFSILILIAVLTWVIPGGEYQRTTVNGFPAIAAISQQVSQNQQTGAQQVIKVMSYLIQDNNLIYVFHGVSDDANFNNYYRIFESTMTNFSRLDEPAKLNVKPKKIKIVQAPAAGTLSQVFKNLKVADSQMKELALLNNIELTDQVAKGKL
ncbi:MAG: hypothetical protein MUC75_08330, partial [Ignavibacteriaceae bacterium]|nr:hypothetical protein [Ignavibacteriaceae bacterium]